MLPKKSEFWTRARRARDKLVDQFLNHPDVNLIDIGFAPAKQGEPTEEIVLRIHVGENWLKAKPAERAAFPEQMDDIPIIVIPGEYRIEPGRLMMETDEHIAPKADNMADNLEEINGIGPDYAQALNKIGIYRFADFGQYGTPDELHQALEEAGVKVQLWRVKKFDWLGQAKAKVLAQFENPEQTSPQKEVEAAQELRQPPAKEAWEQYAGFNLYFEVKTDEQGQQHWRTLVYKSLDPDSFNSREEFPGVEASLWVNWILEQADLPITAKPIPTETGGAAEPIPSRTDETAPPALMAPPGAEIEILDVQLSEIGPSYGVPEKRLMAEICFQISGPKAETLTANHNPFRIEVHTVALESGVSNLVATRLSQLQPQLFKYTSQQSFPIPEFGRYELYSLVLLLPPGELMVSQRGPTFNVGP
jgi:hypothetical protein